MVVGDFTEHVQTLVIGGGPGGYVAAIRAAQLGQKVTLIERDVLGGVCLNVGCIPSKALINVSKQYHQSQLVQTNGLKYGKTNIDFKKTQSWKDNEVVKVLTDGIASLLKKNKVNVVYGDAMFTSNEKIRVIGGSDGKSFTFDHVILATGSRPFEIKGFKYGPRVLDSTKALNLDHIPKSIVIVGGGYIGSELASMYANFGTKVTILEGVPSILPAFSKDLVSEVLKNFEKKGVTVHTRVMANNAIENKDGVVVNYTMDGKEQEIEAEYVLVTVGRKVNTDTLGIEYTDIKLDDKGLVDIDHQGRSSLDTVFAIGDIVKGPQLAHKASYEGKAVAEVIAGKPAGFDYTAIPAVCFTDPEIAVVGLNKDQAQQEGYTVNVATFPFMANGRALSAGKTEGFTRIISEKETGLVIGAEIVGDTASELIAELTMAIESFMSVEDIALIVHAHPTLSESIMDASELALGYPIHI